MKTPTELRAETAMPELWTVGTKTGWIEKPDARGKEYGLWRALPIEPGIYVIHFDGRGNLDISLTVTSDTFKNFTSMI